ncbi:MAG: histidine kinase [Sphingobacteriales bacterium]|nr:histidine kinase [Sphingobacteriales bacterium]
MTLEPFVILLFANIFRRALAKTPENAQWRNALWALMGFTLILIGIDIILDKNFIKWISKIILLALLCLPFVSDRFKHYKSVILALLPYAILSTIADFAKAFTPSLYDSINGLFDTALTFSAIWMVAMLIISSRQRKALQKERRKAELEEKEKERMWALKQELEVQVMERTAEINKQKEELENTLVELKTTQNQLIQQEKMASLGELTAGIAHEIQNPLNFVNNFSDVSIELLNEMEEELKAGHKEDAIAIAADIKQNLQKISTHGQRADSIVKGMLQHSRSATGDKEPTDINALADEYLRLSYHGLRAKDKTFNATLETNYDESIGKIEVIPQDIGRVFLNLFNNAFYAVTEKKKLQADGDYKPVVSVTTIKKKHQVIIKVSDNGIGIPKKAADKIYQPFFTTKPTGEGTGLGLSMSYDIIRKGHNGEIKVASVEGEFTEFTIILPIK